MGVGQGQTFDTTEVTAHGNSAKISEIRVEAAVETVVGTTGLAVKATINVFRDAITAEIKFGEQDDKDPEPARL